MWRHRSVSLNNEKICCEISEDKIAFCEKTAGLRRGTFSDSNSACLKVLVPVKIFQFQDMLNESERYQDAANGLQVLHFRFSFEPRLSEVDKFLFLVPPLRTTSCNAHYSGSTLYDNERETWSKSIDCEADTPCCPCNFACNLCRNKIARQIA